MSVAPIEGGQIVIPVTPVTRVAKLGGAKKTRRPEEPDRPVPEPAPGTGEMVDLYV
jgi:hypothetical protein